MMNDIYLEYILKKKKTGGQKAIIAVIIFAAIIVSVALLLLILQPLLHFPALNSVRFHLVSDLCL